MTTLANELGVDFTGARGSNAGDEFHELWVARQCLRLLDYETDLDAIKVEGTRSSGKGYPYASADCTFFFNGTTNSSAERVEIKQLKYSSARPNESWTVSKISRGKNGNHGKSTLKGLATAFKQLRSERKDKDLTSIKISLITNQPISDNLINELEYARRKTPPKKYTRAWKKGDPDLHRLVYASGLSAEDFHEFAKVMELQGSHRSRSAIKYDLSDEVSRWTDWEFAHVTDKLRSLVREQMLPESSKEYIDRRKVLMLFGISDEQDIFPCPPRIKRIESCIKRDAEKKLAALLLGGEQRICLHGGGGVGKTTVLRQLKCYLPQGSESVIFDCYGGGSYLDASAPRHRPQDAFVQLANEIATRVRLPLILAPRPNNNFARAFRKRLDYAANVLCKKHPEAILLIAIDAADNSVNAARSRGSSEKSFIHDFMSFQDIPSNVKFIVTARSGRLKDLVLPNRYVKFELGSFTPTETEFNVLGNWDAPRSWIEDFHELSRGLPRVQGYALEREAVSPAQKIEFLRPSGKDLPQIFKGMLEDALKKLGESDELEQFCACLVTLPRPIPVSEIASVLDIDPLAVIDFCNDLAPGLTCNGNLVGFADEDFESYVREVAKLQLDVLAKTVSSRFLDRHISCKYAAIHVVPMLELAKRPKELLNLVENHLEPDDKVVTDPVVRQDVGTQRLKLAVSVCNESGDFERAMRFVILGAEAKKSEDIVRSLLIDKPRLTALFAREVGSKIILRDSELIKIHGPLLLNLMAVHAEQENFTGVREYRRRFQAWYERRNSNLAHGGSDREDDWEVSPEDAASILYAEIRESGPGEAIVRHKRFRPLNFSAISAKFFIHRMVAERRFEDIEKLAELLPSIKSSFLLVPLALAGHPIDYSRLSAGLARLLRLFKLDSEFFRLSFQDDSLESWIIDTLLTGAEILIASGNANSVVNQVLAPILDPEARRIDRIYDRDDLLLDAIMRSVTLSNCLDGKQTVVSEVLFDRPETEKDDAKNRRHDRKERDRRLREKIETICPVYIARAQILTRRVKLSEASTILGESCQKLESKGWRYNQDYDFGMMRARVAECLTVLFTEESIKLEVSEAIWSTYGNQWLLNLHRIAPRLVPHEELHESFCMKVSEAAEVILAESTSAYEKSKNLIDYAHLLLPVSTEESETLFQKSIELAKDISFEIADQIKLLDQLVSRGLNGLSDKRSDYAKTLSRIVEDAVTRVKYAHFFPWREAVSAIAQLDTSFALACIARWHDIGMVSLKQTLPTVIQIATSTNEITCATGLALFGVSGSEDGRDLEKLIKLAEEQENCSELAEEVARDVMQDRIVETACVCKFVRDRGNGYWTTKFNELIEFKTNVVEADQEDSKTGKALVQQLPATLEVYKWEREVLCDGVLLKARADTVLKDCREKNEKLSTLSILEAARRKVTFRDQISHLNALLAILEIVQDDSIVRAVISAVTAWKEQPAVKRWCKQKIPRLIAKHLDLFSSDLHWDDEFLMESLKLSQASPSDVQKLLLEGIQENSERLSANVTFSLAGIIASNLDPSSAANLFKWYIGRLSNNISENSPTQYPPMDNPSTVDESIARIVFASLGDVDLRIRWRTAHAIRRLARLGEGRIIERIWQEYNRTSEPIFRDPSAPFYWLAARLWLVISLDRVSSESPSEIRSIGRDIYEIAISDEFPHVLLKSYASDAAFKLHTSGVLPLEEKELSNLKNVNKSLLPHTEETQSLDPGMESFVRSEKEKRRFRFDGLDTLRYWYAPWLRTFSGLSEDEFLRTAESWIVDKWGFKDDRSNSLLKSRSKRFRQKNWEQSSHSHGSLPTLEPYRTHLEWHAMWCTVGNTISSHPLTKHRNVVDDSDELTNRVSYFKLTHPPIWLSDIVGQRPLQVKHWRQTNPMPAGRYSNIEDADFLSELLPTDRPDYVVARAELETCVRGHQETVKVFSALVSPQTGHALVNALQTVETEFNYLLGAEDRNWEISEDGIELKGWLRCPNEFGGFDEKDPFCNGIRLINSLPGKTVTTSHGLSFNDTPYPSWFKNGNAYPSVLYEAWGKEENAEPNRDDRDRVVSSGFRLLVRKEYLAEILAKEEFDLITEIGVKRNELGNRRSVYGTEEEHAVTFDRILLLRGDDKIEGAERNFGSWREDS